MTRLTSTLMLGVFCALAATTTSAAAAGAGAGPGQMWHQETVQGFQKFWTETGQGSRFTIWCNRDRKTAGTVIDVDIDGRNAPARKPIKVVVDRHMIQMPADDRGYVRTDSPAGADGYTVLWNRLRGGVRLQVLFDDDRFAVFSLAGAATTLSPEVCPPDFNK